MKTKGRKVSIPPFVLTFLALLFASFPLLLSASEPVAYTSGGRRDPFGSLLNAEIAKTAVRGDINIEGIIFDPPAGSMVLVNGEFYKPGQKIGESILISIFQDRIILSQNEEEKIFWIREEIVPKSEKNNSPKSDKDSPHA